MFESDNTSSTPSETYDQSVRQIIPFYDTIISETIELVKTIKPEVNCWLDTGSGTGYLVEMALPLFPNADFIIADPSEPMLKQARNRLLNPPNKRVRLLPPTTSEDLLKYKGKIIPQIISAIMCHHYLKRQFRREAIMACYQLLQTEGVFITFEIVAPETAAGIKIAIDRWKRYQVDHGRTPSVAEQHVKRFNSSYYPITIREHLELLGEIGFQTVELFWLSHVHAGFYAIIK